MANVITILKIHFKTIIKSFPMVIVLYILFPLVLSFMANGHSLKDNEGKEEVKKTAITIIDKENSDMTSGLVAFLKQNNVEIVDDSSLTLTIEEGYDEAITNGDENKLVLEEEGKLMTSGNMIRNMLDTYHKSLYVSANGGDASKTLVNSISSSITFEEFEQKNSKQEENQMGVMIVGFIGFLVATFIMNKVQAQKVVKNAKAISHRITAMPKSKNMLLFYEFISDALEFLVIIITYVIVFRIWGVAFMGNVGEIILMMTVTTFITASVSVFFKCLFSYNIGALITMPLMLISMFSIYEDFGGIGEFIAKLNPFAYITKMFEFSGTGVNTGLVLQYAGVIMIIGVLINVITFIGSRYKRVMIK